MSKINSLGGRICGPLPEPDDDGYRHWTDEQIEQHDALRAGVIKRVHVNGHAVKVCSKGGEQVPCITIQTSKGVFRCHELRFHGMTDLIERIQEPLKSGARIWLETIDEVEVLR